MTFTIEAGISDSELPEWLQTAAKKYGTFDDQRVDYTHANIAPIVMCTIVYRGKILLVKRGYGLADAEGFWSTVNGFIDEIKPVAKQAQQEVKEELGIEITTDQIEVRESYTLKNPKEKRRYIVFPCLVTLQIAPQISLDSENTEYEWTTREQLGTYDILDDLPYSIDRALGW